MVGMSFNRIIVTRLDRRKNKFIVKNLTRDSASVANDDIQIRKSIIWIEHDVLHKSKAASQAPVLKILLSWNIKYGM